ncbi:MAG: Sulfate permease 2 [Peltula sp. TS41687]|nr:MAG: Sulfate permease 2 [Peltula sp. TS41687]
MSTTRSKVGHGLAKVLGIKLQYRDELGNDALTRGESVFSVSTADTYVESEPTTWEFIRELLPNGRGILHYLYSLFPFVHWIGRYNLQWFVGDMIAGNLFPLCDPPLRRQRLMRNHLQGVTVGAVVVPQSMAYAALAKLPAEYGLYTSFMGVLIYWFFATSKDITIGPVAVASTVVGDIIIKAQKREPDIDPAMIASAVAILAGSIILFIGLIRFGWIVEFISLTAISAFMTGSAINIAVGQVPALMGLTGFSNREATYKVIINILKHLGTSKLDAAMGLTALAMLYIIRSACSYGAKRVPNQRKTYFFIATMRTAFVILFYTMISWLVNRHHRSKPLFKILGKVPRGFKHARVPVVNKRTINAFISELPATVIVLLIEHIAIAKSFGRLNNYNIDPSQEMIAIGVTNCLGPFLGAYPATGSFSRTAIKSKAGVRTPFAGFITAIVVLLAIYALTAVFFYIPASSLAAVIIHAVGDLITPPNVIYQFWRVSPLEVIIFFAGVFVTIFMNIENGIYTTICTSVAVLLFRTVKARGRFLGRVKIHSVVGGDDGKDGHRNTGLEKTNTETTVRNVFLPIDHEDGSNPQVEVESPYPGIFIYRFSEGFNFPNANHYLDNLTSTISKETRRTNASTFLRPGDRPWNDPGPRRGRAAKTDSHLPTLQAIVLDFSSVNNVDITSVQNLIDVRNQLDRWASPDIVEWHFACITNRWTKRALVSAGFGYPTPGSMEHFERWKPIFDVAEIGGSDSAAVAAEAPENAERRSSRKGSFNDGIFPATSPTSTIHQSASNPSSDVDLEKAAATQVRTKKVVVHGINRPLFHTDLTSALQAAVSSVEWKRGDDKARRVE